MEYIDMIRRMAMTPMAMGPRFLIISLIVKFFAMSLPASDPPPASCRSRTRKPTVFDPSRVISIVTVEPSKFFQSQQERVRARGERGHGAGDLPRDSRQ